MGCAPTKPSKGEDEHVASKSFDAVATPAPRDREGQRVERERLMNELDALRAPDSSVGDMCREPAVGRAVMATFLAEGSMSGSGPPADSSKVRQAMASANMTDATAQAITQWRQALVVDGNGAQDQDPMNDLKGEWDESGSLRHQQAAAAMQVHGNTATSSRLFGQAVIHPPHLQHINATTAARGVISSNSPQPSHPHEQHNHPHGSVGLRNMINSEDPPSMEMSGSMEVAVVDFSCLSPSSASTNSEETDHIVYAAAN